MNWEAVVLFFELFTFQFSASFKSKFSFSCSLNDWTLYVLAFQPVTAYALLHRQRILKYISPYTVILTGNLEPVYGNIYWHFLISWCSEKMIHFSMLGSTL